MNLKRLLHHEDIGQDVSSSSSDWDAGFLSEEQVNLSDLDLSWTDVLANTLNPPRNALEQSDSQVTYDLHCEFPAAVGVEIETWAYQDHYNGISTSSLPRNQTSRIQEIPPEFLCYGMIYRTRVRLLGNMQAHLKSIPEERTLNGGSHCVLSIARLDTSLHVLLSDGSRLAILNQALNDTFIHEDILDKVILQVIVTLSSLRKAIKNASRASEAHTNVDINVYGSIQDLNKIGQHLTTHKIWLQKPDWYEQENVYSNPQVLHIGRKYPSSTSVPVHVDMDVPLAEQSNLDAVVSGIYSSLTRANHLERTAGDIRLATKLLPHQEKALHFMIERENGPISDEYSLWQPMNSDGIPFYQHSIAEIKEYELPSEVGGGILADEMGMGKTFSMLALIVRTLSEARTWASDPETHLGDLNCQSLSRATLVIVPSPLILNNWQSELIVRVGMSELSCLLYHGTDRPKNVSAIIDHDIVLTTYQTLVSERGRGDCLLTNVGWFRIVLDEAHFIRRSTTKFHRCVSEIEARSRWCLTGTPIQNHLDDIGALFSFLRIEPFDKLGLFRKHISLPYQENRHNHVACQRHLRMLIDATCLRRERTLLGLDNVDEIDYAVDFSTEERRQYLETKSELKAYMDMYPDSAPDKNRFGMFQAMLHLRLVCNHGTYQQQFGLRSMASRSDVRDTLLNFAMFDGELRCDFCDQMVRVLSGDDYSRLRPFSCQHVICEDCRSIHDVEAIKGGKCGSPQSAKTYSNAKISDRRTSRFNHTGVSSKMLTLLRHLSACSQDDKSIVFSCWTSTLDLIEHHLRPSGIPYRRIDGDLPVKHRESILEEFDDDPTIKVLLMTTGVGGFGIDLIAANHVFLIEPQWNPSVESQAIGRALRIGQSRRVKVIRYYIRNSDEEDIRKLQRNKTKIATMATHA